MSNIAISLFAAGAVFLAATINGLLAEWIASKFVSDDAARFGGFCFVLGLLLGGSAKFVSFADSADTVGLAIGSVAALILLCLRALRIRSMHEVAH